MLYLKNCEERDSDLENLNVSDSLLVGMNKEVTNNSSKVVYYVKSPVRTVLRRGRKNNKRKC